MAKRIAVLLAGAVLMAGAGAGGAWWLLQPAAPDGQADAEEAVRDAHEYKYLDLEKIVVMLRGSAGEPLSHYMAVDLVFKTPVEHEKLVRQHLPLLRSIAVKSMSAYTMEKATLMSVEQFAADINAAYVASYAADRTTMPFAEAMIGKLIIE
jgi:flagellar FliL protein